MKQMDMITHGDAWIIQRMPSLFDILFEMHDYHGRRGKNKCILTSHLFLL